MNSTTIAELQIEYNKKLPLFHRALKNTVDALELFMEEHNILHLVITGRIKSFESFAQKVDRKNYKDPFVENEDFCGIRIIVFYPSDINAVQEIIDTEFQIVESFDKVDSLEANEFGYRSKHSIVMIKDEWLSSPNYRSLQGVKIEIQVRTILMHAWAEIEHKLAYKNANQIRKDVKRQLARISAQLETTDEQFQNLKDSIQSYQDDIKLSVQISKAVPATADLDYDSVNALLEYYLPDLPNNRGNLIRVMERLANNHYSLSKVEELLKKIRPYILAINEAVFPRKELSLTRATILGYAMDIFEGYDSSPTVAYSETRRTVVEAFRKIVSEVNDGS